MKGILIIICYVLSLSVNIVITDDYIKGLLVGILVGTALWIILYVIAKVIVPKDKDWFEDIK